MSIKSQDSWKFR